MTKLFLIALVLIISILFKSCVLPTYFGQTSLIEMKRVEDNKKVTNVLFIGTGTLASRSFLDNLSDELIKLFEKEKIQCDFTFLKNEPINSLISKDKVAASKYDCYLLINSKDTAYTNFHKKVGDFIMPSGNINNGLGMSSSIYGNQYKEDFYVEILVKGKNELKQIWRGELRVDCDLSRRHNYKNVSQSLFGKVVHK